MTSIPPNLSANGVEEPHIPVVPKETFALGDVFSSQDEARSKVRASLIDHDLSWKVDKGDTKRTVYKCRGTVPCLFRVRISRDNRTGNCSITINEPHTCDPSTHYGFSGANAKSYLSRHLGHIITGNPKIKARALSSIETAHHQNSGPSQLQFHRTKQAVIKSIHGSEQESYAKFPGYIERFKQAHKDNYAAMKTNPDTNQFQAAFFAPAPTRQAYTNMRGIYFVDGTHIFSIFNLLLLLFMGIDANGHGVLLAWALVPIENIVWWSWFFYHIGKAFDFLTEEPSATIPRYTVMSDRQKGGIEALQTNLPYALASHCCKHIADNVESRFGKANVALFWKCAFAITQSKFEEALEDIAGPAKKYINDIPHETWTTYKFPIPRYGHITNNVVESQNSTFGEIRQQPPLQMLDLIYQHIMKQWRPRFDQVQKNKDVADVPLAAYIENYEYSRKYYAVALSTTIYQVEIPNTTIRWVIDFKNQTCSCTKWQEMRYPCAHACCALRRAQLNGIDDPYFDDLYSTSTLKDTYRHMFYPILLDDLPVDKTIQPPAFKIPIGRPRTKRIRKSKHHGDIRRVICSNCHQKDHNKQTCPNAPVANGRAQRRRDDAISEEDEDTGSEVEQGIIKETQKDPAFAELNRSSQKRLVQHQIRRANTRYYLGGEDNDMPSENGGLNGDDDPFALTDFSGFSGSDDEAPPPEGSLQPITPLPPVASTRRRRASEITKSPTKSLLLRQSTRIAYMNPRQSNRIANKKMKA